MLPVRGSEGGKAGSGLDEFRVEGKTAVGVDQRFVGNHIQISIVIPQI